MTVPSIMTGRYPSSRYAVAFNRGPRAFGSAHGLCVIGQKPCISTPLTQQYDAGPPAKSYTVTAKKPDVTWVVTTGLARTLTVTGTAVAVQVIVGVSTLAEVIADIAASGPATALITLTGDAGTFPGGYAGQAITNLFTSYGSATVNVPVRIDDAAAALTYAGAGGEAYRALLPAVAKAKGKVPVYLCATTNASGAWATYTSTISGTATADGVLKVTIGTDVCQVSVTSGQGFATVGAAIAAAYSHTTGTQPLSPAVCTYAAGTLTWQAKCAGTSGNSIRALISDIPAGLAFGSPTGLFTSGAAIAGYDAAYDAVLGVLFDVDYVLPCTIDTAAITASGMLRDEIIDAADPGVGHLCTAALGCNTTEGDATTMTASLDLGGTDYDEPAVWFEHFPAVANQAEPWVIAAEGVSIRANKTVVDRNANFGQINKVATLSFVPVPASTSSYPTKASIEAMLAAGCSPIEYVLSSGTARVVRFQTCKHVTAGSADFRAADTNVADVGAYLAKDQSQALADEYGGCVIADDVDGREPEDLGQNTVTASLMASTALARYKSRFCGTLGWCEEVYRDATTGEVTPIDDQFAFERDSTDSSRINGVNPFVVKRWCMGIGVRYEEIGY